MYLSTFFIVSERQFDCDATLWKSDCLVEGSRILQSHRLTRRDACESYCADEDKCLSYIYDEASANCGLLRQSEGESTKTIGLSGPDLKLVVPSRRRKRAPPAAEPDCRDFHFEDCREYDEPRVRYSSKIPYAEDCQAKCVNPDNPLYECQSWVYVRSEMAADQKCWWNAETNRMFIAEQCNVHRGRVGPNLADFDTCLDIKAKGCRVSYTSLKEMPDVGK